MSSFELDLIDEKTRAGIEFLTNVVHEMRRALIIEKSSRKITQQSIADKIGTSRHVINRELQGLENVSARRIGEYFWSIGWEPHFEAKKSRDRENCGFIAPPAQPREPVPPAIFRPSSAMSGAGGIFDFVDKAKGAPVPVV